MGCLYWVKGGKWTGYTGAQRVDVAWLLFLVLL